MGISQRKCLFQPTGGDVLVSRSLQGELVRQDLHVQVLFVLQGKLKSLFLYHCHAALCFDILNLSSDFDGKSAFTFHTLLSWVNVWVLRTYFTKNKIFKTSHSTPLPIRD